MYFITQTHKNDNLCGHLRYKPSRFTLVLTSPTKSFKTPRTARFTGQTALKASKETELCHTVCRSVNMMKPDICDSSDSLPSLNLD